MAQAPSRPFASEGVLRSVVRQRRGDLRREAEMDGEGVPSAASGELVAIEPMPLADAALSRMAPRIAAAST